MPDLAKTINLYTKTGNTCAGDLSSLIGAVAKAAGQWQWIQLEYYHSMYFDYFSQGIKSLEQEIANQEHSQKFYLYRGRCWNQNAELQWRKWREWEPQHNFFLTLYTEDKNIEKKIKNLDGHSTEEQVVYQDELCHLWGEDIIEQDEQYVKMQSHSFSGKCDLSYPASFVKEVPKINVRNYFVNECRIAFRMLEKGEK